MPEDCKGAFSLNYYNDNDPGSVAWLRELIKHNLIPAGDVDERSIKDVTGSDLKGYTQCHFFAGIGGWSEALRLAGWPTDEPVWTGSCPCQPFSCAGKGEGEKDPRHLWPEFYRLIKECRPITVFGEQVEKAIGMGWLDGVFADLEGEGYTCGAAVLGAHSVGAPHIRQRLYWVADTENERHEWSGRTRTGRERFENDSSISRLADSSSIRCNKRGKTTTVEIQRECAERSGKHQESECVGKLSGRPEGLCGSGFWSKSIFLPCRDGKQRRISSEPSAFPLAHGIPGRVGLLRGYGNAIVPEVAAEFIKAYMDIARGLSV
jgi:DNA (cytosine-5)-methyltransferase 1